MAEYEKIALAGISLIYIAEIIYLERKRRKATKEFKDFADDYAKTGELADNIDNKLEGLVKQ